MKEAQPSVKSRAKGWQSFANKLAQADEGEAEMKKRLEKSPALKARHDGLIALFAKGQQRAAKVSCIAQGVYLGSHGGATDLGLLRRLGITHVVNMAGNENATGAAFYTRLGIAYCELYMTDLSGLDPAVPVAGAVDFMAAALGGVGQGEREGAGGGQGKGKEDKDSLGAEEGCSKVLVHCSHGVSRSPTVVAAFLVRHRRYTAHAALAAVLDARPCVRPNDGFLYFLLLLEGEKEEERRAAELDEASKQRIS